MYTGIATNVQNRITEHQNGARGAKYLRGKGPLTLEFVAEVGDRAAASRLEYRVKRLSRDRKEALIRGDASVQELSGGDASGKGSA